jgi:hypothetical protein
VGHHGRVPNPSQPVDVDTPLPRIELIIGEALLEDDFGSKPAGDEEKRAIARRWFESNLASFQRLICASAVVREAVLSPANKDRNALIGALIDVLNASFGLTVPVAALSVMIIHYGLGRLCPALEPSEDQ